MASGRIQLVVKDLPIHHFPSKPTCLAYDNEAKKLAIGCDNGEIIILDGQQYHILQQLQAINGGKATNLLLSFGIGKDILLAAHKNKNHLLLWSTPYKNNPTQVVLPVNEYLTVLAWSFAYSTFFVGTTAGTVYQVFVSDNKMEIVDRTASMLRDKCNSAGKVVAIVEEPQTVREDKDTQTAREDKDTQTAREDKDTHNVLVVFSSGWCVLWNQQKGYSLQEQINDAETSVCVPLYAWWISSTHVYIACTDGSVRGFQYDLTNKGWKRRQTSPSWVPEGLKSVKSITKLQSILNSTSLLYVGECSSLPTESNASNVLSKFTIWTKEYVHVFLAPFGGRIVDILYLHPSAEQDPSVLAVLTESELVLLNMSTKPQEIEHSCGKIMQQYPRLSQFNGYPHFTPTVTCLQHCGVCSQEFLKSVQSQEKLADLIITGHKDGSVYLWLCYHDDSTSLLSFKLTLVVYTAEYYDITQTGPEVIQLLEVSLAKVTSDQQYLLVVSRSCHLLLFKLSLSTGTHTADKTGHCQPQSQEVILKDLQDATPPEKLLQTPSPQLRSCQWQSRVQLLQHFICYYMYKSGRGKKLDPVPVNCVEYDKELAMLAVGTDKGLIILDTLTNTLTQVIGSEKKLLELSGCGDHGGSPSNSEQCKVVKLCAAKMCLTASQQDAPQFTLWVGTTGGALGVFTVTRNKDGEQLQLGKTGEGKQESSAISSILLVHNPTTPGNDTGEEQAYRNALEDMNESSSTTYAVVTTDKKCYIHYVKKADIKDTTMTSNILTSGVVLSMDKPYLICLLENETVNIYSLPDMNEMNVEGAIPDVKSSLYSSTKSFSVLQISQSVNLKLITLQQQCQT